VQGQARPSLGDLAGDVVADQCGQLLRCGHIGQLALPGLRADKAPVVAGGLSVLLAIFHTLQLQAMVPAQGALRIGVLHSLCTPTA